MFIDYTCTISLVSAGFMRTHTEMWRVQRSRCSITNSESFYKNVFMHWLWRQNHYSQVLWIASCAIWLAYTFRKGLFEMSRDYNREFVLWKNDLNLFVYFWGSKNKMDLQQNSLKLCFMLFIVNLDHCSM